MSTKRAYGIPSVEFSRLADEAYENSPEVAKLKQRMDAGRIQREESAKAKMLEVFNDPEMTLAEKVKARERIQQQVRIAAKSDPLAAQYRAGKTAAGQRAQRDLAVAFDGRPSDQFVAQEINYYPNQMGAGGGHGGRRGGGDSNLASSEVIRFAKERAVRNGTPFTPEQEIAALKAQGAQLIPQELADTYSAEKQGRMAAFDARERDQAKADFASTQAQVKAGARVRADVARARTAAVSPRINVNDFQFNSGGTLERGGQRFEVAPGLGAERAATPAMMQPEPAVPYGQTPEEFVAPAPESKTTIGEDIDTVMSTWPTMAPVGNRRPRARLVTP